MKNVLISLKKSLSSQHNSLTGMKKHLVITCFLFLSVLSSVMAGNGGRDYAIGFYNLENLFDTCHDAGKNDYEFLPEGTNHWTSERYVSKLHNMARVLSEMGTAVLPEGCAAIGVAEVENAHCLDDLCQEPVLRERGFRYVHVEGPDQRGIDCALLYQPQLFQVRNVSLVPYLYRLPEDSLRASRGFLVVSGTLADEHVTIIVNHLPSRGAPAYYREEGGRQIRVVKDSLQRDDPSVKILVMGDMNDDPQNRSMAHYLRAKRHREEVGLADMYNPWWETLSSGTGTLAYRGEWNLFDQIILSPTLLSGKGLRYRHHQVFRPDYLIVQEGKFKGYPYRTFGSGQWLNGYSDHLPTIVYLTK